MTEYLHWLLLANGLAVGLFAIAMGVSLLEKDRSPFPFLAYTSLSILNLVAAGAVWPYVLVCFKGPTS